jgi:hypothetical protein
VLGLPTIAVKSPDWIEGHVEIDRQLGDASPSSALPGGR